MVVFIEICMFERDKSRREFLEWASAVGLASIAPATIADVADASEDRSSDRARAERAKPDSVPAARRGDPEAPVDLVHPTERASVRQRVEQAQQDDDSRILYHPRLEREVRERDDDERINLAVTTVGERNSVVTNHYGRRIDGWRPTDDEVGRLGQFGDVAFAPKFINTKVSMTDVRVGDVEKIASLPFVVRVNYDEPDQPLTDKRDLRTSDYYWFENVEDNYEIGSTDRIAVIDDGYEAGEGNFAEPHAEQMGISGLYSKDFTPDGDWSDVTFTRDGEPIYHGTTVADNAAFMLDPDGEQGGFNFAIMKVANEDDSGFPASRIREALEYSLENDIEVANCSFGSLTDGTCPSSYCSEYEAYARAGYIPLAAAGNDGSDEYVSNTGGSAWSIGVGGFHGSCDDEPERHSSSNIGTQEYNGTWWPACSECYDRAGSSEEHPWVYGAYWTNTDDGWAGGTSNATPQAAAAALIMQSNGLFDYDEAESIFKNMTFQDICPDDAAPEGQLLDAWDAYYRTN